MKRIGILLVILTLISITWAGQLSTLVERGQPEGRPAMTDPETCQDEWYWARTVTANDTELSTTTRTWNYATSRFFFSPRRWASISISVVGYGDGSGAGDPASGSFNWTLYACRRWGPPEIVGTGTWAIGAMQVSHNPSTGVAVGTDSRFSTSGNSNYKWGELPVVTTRPWATLVWPSGAADHVGQLNFDLLGCWGAYLEITSISNVTSLHVFATGRSQ